MRTTLNILRKKNISECKDIEVQKARIKTEDRLQEITSSHAGVRGRKGSGRRYKSGKQMEQ